MEDGGRRMEEGGWSCKDCDFFQRTSFDFIFLN